MLASRQEIGASHGIHFLSHQFDTYRRQYLCTKAGPVACRPQGCQQQKHGRLHNVAGATFMAGERYGDEVRVIDVPGVSMELCGGTHVDATSQIGAFKVLQASVAVVP